MTILCQKLLAVSDSWLIFCAAIAMPNASMRPLSEWRRDLRGPPVYGRMHE
ncbi:hypothetical protein ACVILL_001279 [Bradyrhizobium sp. USDA 3364]